ncbi:MAG: excinuclease ABC subunit UvrA [Bacteroidales bacterium]|jgi:excinuclease ABC subunit A|nr:excinuclease ABC subunit UvrA [Bacteroidales bacterium]
MNKNIIILRGIQVNNLKNINVEIPRNQLVVVTGLSGSGKSSLVFDTIYAEGQRRYTESISAYARQFLGKIRNPSIEMVHGIPPAIAIEQKVGSHNSRSTVGTVTEIYEHIKMLYTQLGRTYSPVSGKEVKRDSVNNVFDFIFNLDEESKIMILAPFTGTKEKSIQQRLQLFLQQGFSRLYRENKIIAISDCLQQEFSEKEKLYLLIDRCTLKNEEENKNRLVDSIETAYFEGDGQCTIVIFNRNGDVSKHNFSNKFEKDGMVFRVPNINMFSFTNSYGACSICNGLGEITGVNPDLMIPDKSLSVYDDAVVLWKSDKLSEYKHELLKNAYKFDFPIYKAIQDLSQKEYNLLWSGNKHFRGINKSVQWLEENSYKIQYRSILSRYKGRTVCPECKGSRLAKDASYVKIGNKTIREVVTLPLGEALLFFKTLKFKTKAEIKISSFLLQEINTRIQFLCDLGLSYLTLNRSASTLSGGEYQRVNLATSLGSNLVGSLYILDEPSVGLHSVDTHLLISLLKYLRDIGNTVLVVEHDEDIIRAADYIIDMGPYAGKHGGEIVFKGKFRQLKKSEKSITAQYINGTKKIDFSKKRRKAKRFILLENADLNNLKKINVKIPLGVFSVITGVSGSGKTSLIKGVLYPELKFRIGGSLLVKNELSKLSGDIKWVDNVELVDQNPIGRSSRSNPATYMGAFDYIRQLYAEQPLAKARGYKAGFFSLNTEGGRCETCQGDGKIKIAMQFMSDVEVVCDECNGIRYKEEILEVKIKDKSISDILNLSIDEVVGFFSSLPNDRFSKHIVTTLKPLQDVGLGYLTLGQSSSSLSGGEAQRIKLAFFLGKSSETKNTIFIFDEPTTGLHYYDIHKLYNIFEILVEYGHTVIVIEHNLELIKCADWIIDLGPGGGDKGGEIVIAGTVEDVMKCPNSITGKFLKKKLEAMQS